jgi:histidinol-phosphate/aromatic aminotransferase/cobyric acid decarboxylase-like protein
VVSADGQLLPQLHGGLIAAELAGFGLDPGSVVDFSVNVNPYGPAPLVAEAARHAEIGRYPEPTAGPLRDAIALRLGVARKRIVVGSGSAELLWALARATLARGDTAFVVGPTFSEINQAAGAVGAEVRQWRAEASTGFAVNLGAVVTATRSARARLLYLCSPNNPTGAHVPVEAIAEAAAALPGVVVALDQAFLSLSPRWKELAAELPPSVVCLRSMTKDHAIPGLRLGYLLSTPEIAGAVEAQRPPWTVSAPAHAAGLAALQSDAFLAESRDRLLADRDALATELRAIGLAPSSSATVFLLVPVPDASALRARLLRRGLLVRDCTSFGLSGYIRLGARPEPDRRRLVAALREDLGC